MPYCISFLSYLMRSLIVIVLLCVLLTSSCTDHEEVKENFHPIWAYLNEKEDHLDEDKCIFTKFGGVGLRFHVTPHQTPFNLKDFYSEYQKNIIQTHTKVNNWVLTPNFYGSMTEAKFPKTLQAGMKYKFHSDNKEFGIPVEFLEEWLAIDPIDHKDAILIISTGIEGKLGVSELLKKALKDKKNKGEIKAYTILMSKHAVIKHNTYVKEGEKVFTFIHTAA